MTYTITTQGGDAMGAYIAGDEPGAILAYVRDAGYASVADAVDADPGVADLTAVAARSLTLSEAETAAWEDDGPDGDTYRAQVRGEHTGPTEIYSHDGITLDAWS